MVRAGPHLAEIYIPVSVVALSAWWQIDRFLVPLLPFLMLYLAVGIQLLSVAIADVINAGMTMPQVGARFIAPGEPCPPLNSLWERARVRARAMFTKTAIADGVAEKDATSSAGSVLPKHYVLVVLIAAPIILSSIVQDYSAIRSNVSRAGAKSESEHFAETKPDSANYFRAAEWLRMNSPLDSTVMSLKPYLMYAYV